MEERLRIGTSRVERRLDIIQKRFSKFIDEALSHVVPAQSDEGIKYWRMGHDNPDRYCGIVSIPEPGHIREALYATLRDPWKISKDRLETIVHSPFYYRPYLLLIVKRGGSLFTLTPDRTNTQLVRTLTEGVTHRFDWEKCKRIWKND